MSADSPTTTPPALELTDLRKEFRGRRRRGTVTAAVDGVTITVEHGECLAIVGESGCGKSTLARLLMGLIPPTSGSVLVEGRDLATMSRTDLRAARRDIQMIFQDPYASLHPRKVVRDIIAEAWRIHPGIVSRRDEHDEIERLLRQVGLPARYADVYPARLSGGQRQRVAIARGLALRPKVLVLDEPVSALDVSIQAQVIRLLMQLRLDHALTYVFISHDLNLVRMVADRVAVMRAGRFVEVGTTAQVMSDPKDAFTRELLDSSPPLLSRR